MKAMPTNTNKSPQTNRVRSCRRIDSRNITNATIQNSTPSKRVGHEPLTIFNRLDRLRARPPRLQVEFTVKGTSPRFHDRSPS